jgi:hypothetical protein
MNIEDFDALARMLGQTRLLAPNRVPAAGDAPVRTTERQPSPLSLGMRPQFRSAAAPVPARTEPFQSAPLAGLFMVFAAIFAAVFISGFVSAAVLVGLFGIPYLAFLVVYPAVVTLSSFLRTLPTLFALARAKANRGALLTGGLIGALLVLPATFYLARWGADAFGLLLPAGAKATQATGINYQVSMAFDMKAIPAWVREMTPYVSLGGALIGLMAQRRAKTGLAREEAEAAA